MLSNDFDDRQGDKYAIYKAVIFNPVPGPPVGKATRLSFRYHLTGANWLRLQIYSLSKGYHRNLTVVFLEQGRWAEATVDMTQARRPDGSGGPLSEDERIDDIQFYADPTAELLIDDIVLYDAAPSDAAPNDAAPNDAAEGAGIKGARTEEKPFPKQILFTGWFDTGKQGVEWPGDFEIVPHEKPRTWKAARAVALPDSKSRWIRVDLRGPRPLAAQTRLHFHYLVRGTKEIGIELGLGGVDRRAITKLANAKDGAWAEADLSLTKAAGQLQATAKAAKGGPAATEIIFRVPADAGLLVDDVLLYEPRDKKKNSKPPKE